MKTLLTLLASLVLVCVVEGQPFKRNPFTTNSFPTLAGVTNTTDVLLVYSKDYTNTFSSGTNFFWDPSRGNRQFLSLTNHVLITMSNFTRGRFYLTVQEPALGSNRVWLSTSSFATNINSNIAGGIANNSTNGGTLSFFVFDSVGTNYSAFLQDALR